MKGLVVLVLALCTLCVSAIESSAFCSDPERFSLPFIRSPAMNKAMHLKEKLWKKCEEGFAKLFLLLTNQSTSAHFKSKIKSTSPV